MKRKKIIIIVAVLVLGFALATLWVGMPRASSEKKHAKERTKQDTSAVNADSGFYLQGKANTDESTTQQNVGAGSGQSEQNTSDTLELVDESRFNDETFVKGIFSSMAVKEADPDVDSAVDSSVVELIGSDADLSSWYEGREDTTVIEEITTVDITNHTVTFSNLQGDAKKTYSYTVKDNKIVSAEVVN
jgi:lipopolysaccharide export LptBFGC system permease protein LptF